MKKEQPCVYGCRLRHLLALPEAHVPVTPLPEPLARLVLSSRSASGHDRASVRKVLVNPRGLRAHDRPRRASQRAAMGQKRRAVAMNFGHIF